MITIETKYSKKMYDELFNNSIIICSVCAIIGLLIFIFYLVTYITLHSSYMLFCGLFIMICSFITTFMSLYQKSTQIKKDLNKKSVTVFNEDYMEVTDYNNEEQIGFEKVYYKDIIKIRETKNFLFLYPNRVLAYPISKDNLTIENINQIKSLVGKN